jgi:hypothetical protein
MALAETEQLTRMVASAALSRAIGTIAELGVADHLRKGAPQKVEKLAQLTGAPEGSLYRLLRFTASYQVFRETGHREVDHTPLSATLRTDTDHSFRPTAQMFHRIFAGWDGLHHAVKTGEPSFQEVYGLPRFEYIGANPELAQKFDAGMTAFSRNHRDAGGHRRRQRLAARRRAAPIPTPQRHSVGPGPCSRPGSRSDAFARIIGPVFGVSEQFLRVRSRRSRRLLDAPCHPRLDRRAVHSDSRQLPQSNPTAWAVIACRIRHVFGQSSIAGQGCRHAHAGIPRRHGTHRSRVSSAVCPIRVPAEQRDAYKIRRKRV